MFQMIDDNNNMKSTRDMTKVLNEIQEKPEYNLSKDTIQKNERLIRSLVDIVSENFITINELKVTEINLSSNLFVKEVDQFITQFRDVMDVYKSKAIEWDPKDDIPLKPSHLVIMKDTQDLWQRDLETLIQHLYDSIQTNGFLLSVLRYKFTDPEIAFMSITGATEIQTEDLDCQAEHNVDNVWLVANDSCINGIIEPGGENCRYIFHMDTNTDTNIDFNTKPYSDILANDLVANVIKGGKLGTYRHIKLPTDYDKCLSNDYHLNCGQIKDLSGLQWYDSRCIPEMTEQFNINNLSIGKTRVEIYCAGITFHDVMLATGRIPAGPEQLFIDCSLGCEYVGRRVDTGERVMGIDMGRTFATSLNASIHSMTTIPEHWSMADAATILSTYSTLYYALFKRANLQKGESILIHSGAGGVGQAALNICKHYECDIYATVGTEEKKQFLMTEYNIPENKIFNSRDILFKNQIKEATKGRGVDIVLNSLSGDKLDASYECVANNGRIVEIGKYDMISNKQLGMFDFIRNIQLIGVSFEFVVMDDIHFFTEFYDWVHKNSKNGCVRPLNYTVFKAKDADKAFRFMTTGKHIGKVVIKMRDEETERQTFKSIKPALNMTVTVKTYFDPNKVYIITGGLGGFGLELIPWMQYSGARKFVVTSSFKYFASEWFVSTANGFTIEGTRELLEESRKLGPIGGLFHLAVNLNDSLLENISIEQFCSSIDTKHKIFANLDQLTRQLDYKLDYFVVFSSLACGKGNAGQSNYAFGNSMCERICEERRRDGLHGLAIQYGPIGDVGVFADSSDQVLAMTTLRKQRINSCCDVLDKLLAIKQPIVTSYIKVYQMKETGSKQKRMVAELWRALGIDPETTPNHLTLGMLKDYESGNVVKIKQYMDDIKRAKANLIKQKFIIPCGAYVRLNNVAPGFGGKPVYFMPTFRLNFSMFEELAAKLNRPAIGLNWTREVSKFTTFKQVSEYYVKLLQTLEPTGRYDVVGYLDSALICSKLLLKGAADRAVIVDVISDQRFRDQQLTEDQMLEIMLGIIANDIPDVFRAKITRELKHMADVRAKVKHVVNELVDFAGGTGSQLVATDMEEIMHIMLARIGMFSAYRQRKKVKLASKLKNVLVKRWAKMTGKLVLIKPFKSDLIEDLDELLEASRDVYLLPGSKDTTDTIHIELVDSPTGGVDLMAAEISEMIGAALK
ncbi:unnamed protein product [Medioppia subpectinata]|uniref:Uncharacterized protein n=1 Tax=Medioppia subpectinata TaxID=1979941 RepID=A0A7R9PU23_9ACAR|nr:unnamed protein product [Medioppia subpectinata]CAG2100765.1 unnamed protein product [Medioppia subpectinata]